MSSTIDLSYLSTMFSMFTYLLCLAYASHTNSVKSKSHYSVPYVIQKGVF